MHFRRQRAIIFLPIPVSQRCSTATFVPATAVLIPPRVQEVLWQAATALQGNKSKKRNVLSVTTHQKHRNAMGDRKGSFIDLGLLPPTKYQATATTKGSMKASHCKGHKFLLSCKALGRSNTEIVTISSCNDGRMKNSQDVLLCGTIVFTKLFREHPQLCICNLLYDKMIEKKN